MKFKFIKTFLLIAGIGSVFSACFKDLDTTPLDEDEFTSAVVYDDPTSYRKVLAKVYAGMAVSGQRGPDGAPDIAGIDEGFSTYLRQYWKAQELSTDEAVIGWNDGNIKDFHNQDWDANNEFIAAMYSRIFYQISLCNEFLRESTDEKLSSRGQDNLKGEVALYRAEARFMRALSYWHALDLFRNVPFVTEEDKVGAFFPEQIQAGDLLHWIEEELKSIEGSLAAPRSNEYGRADQAAAWTLLAKLYLNAETHTGDVHYTECIEYCNKIIAAGYSLDTDYAHLFLADNHTADGIIFPVTFDGTRTKTWGGMTFVVHAGVGGSMNVADFGIDFGWGGTRTTSAFVNKFPSGGSGEVVVAPNPGNTGYPVLNLPGSYQGWDPALLSTVVTSPGADEKYEGYFNFTEVGTKFKFAQGGWDVNWGDTGADGTLDAGGTDIDVAEPGFYRVTADIPALTYTLVKTNWGLIGDATGSWDNDQDMTYDAATSAWSVTLDLVVGAVKFRANDAWDLNYGDTGADAILEANGDNIAITEPGSYTFKLFLDSPDHTYSIERAASADSRSMFYTNGQSLEIADIGLFTDGYAITKFKNKKSDGSNGSDPTFVDNDFPMFRIEDVFLMYAEAVLRGGGGDAATALGYVNAIRARAYGGGTAGNITSGDLTLDFILDERSREFYWECHRRTDLVRFGKFSESGYFWPWKGGVPEGASTAKKFDVYPIPSGDLGTNPNLVQNPGY